jgi:adenosylmethionine-8-amino-7-oxononanoate aminotransferase
MQDVQWLRAGLPHIWLPYAQMKTAPQPMPVIGAEGSRLQLADGRELVDGVASWWTAVHGYRPRPVLAAVRRQLDALPHVMLGGLAHEQALTLAARLCGLAPGGMQRAFFSESGSVAVEVAMKIAIQFWRNAAGETRTRFVSFLGGYHGDTFATMSVCDPEEGMHALFAGALAAQHVVALPDTADRLAALDELLARDRSVAAVLVEPLVQGASGMRMHAAATLRALRELCDRHGALLIFDEIFTGFGRTGAMLAADRAGVAPDIITLGKGLTAGVAPLAATLVSGRVYAAFHSDDASHALMHGPTFTGHALGCAAANASLDLFAGQPRLEQARAIEARLAAGLAPLKGAPGVGDVRSLGAIGVVEMAAPFDLQASRRRFVERGVFIRPIVRSIYVTPALTIPPADLDRLIEAIAEEVAAIGGT